MAYRDDYKAIFWTVQQILDESYYNGINSFAPDKITCSEYSLIRPAFKFAPTKENALLIYVIEINNVITDEIFKSWVAYSHQCTFLKIIIPEEIKAKVETLLAREISNYEVHSFRFKKIGTNRIVEIDM